MQSQNAKEENQQVNLHSTQLQNSKNLKAIFRVSNSKTRYKTKLIKSILQCPQILNPSPAVPTKQTLASTQEFELKTPTNNEI
jgi:hypothetical protein